MTKILIVEDELIIAEDIKTTLLKNNYNVVGIAMDYDEAIVIIENNTIDLIILDINLNAKKTGIDLATALNEKYKIPFIFSTSYSDSATLEKVKHTNPLNYLVKPFKREQLLTTIEIAQFKISEKLNSSKKAEESFIIKDAIFIKDKFKYTKLNFNDILWVKSDGNYLDIKTNHKDEVIRASLSNFIDKLNNDLFFRTHKSYIVNLEFIANIETNFITIADTKIPITKNYHDDLMRKLNIV